MASDDAREVQALNKIEDVVRWLLNHEAPTQKSNRFLVEKLLDAFSELVEEDSTTAAGDMESILGRALDGDLSA